VTRCMSKMMSESERVQSSFECKVSVELHASFTWVRVVGDMRRKW